MLTISQAIELVRRLVFQAIHPVGSGTPVQVNIPSVILFDSYNPSALQVRAIYKQATRTGGSHSLSSFAKYPHDHPLMSFIATHMRHCMKLMGEWKLRPLAPEMTGELRTAPPVHFLRALPGSIDEVTDPDECTGYWTKAILPTLDLGRIKVMENSDHLGIWKPGKAEEVTEWLKHVLNV
jgi:hypothetical protein